MNNNPWQIHNPDGTFRVIVTKALPGRRWLDILTAADCRVEICHSTAVLDTETIKAAIGEPMRRRHRTAHRTVGRDAFRCAQDRRGNRVQQLCRGLQQRGSGCGHPGGHSGGQHAGRAHRNHC